MTATATERAIIDGLAAAKPLWTASGSCAACLENGEVVDEAPDMMGGEQVVGLCYNCEATAFEIDEDYAREVIYGGSK